MQTPGTLQGSHSVQAGASTGGLSKYNQKPLQSEVQDEHVEKPSRGSDELLLPARAGEATLHQPGSKGARQQNVQDEQTANQGFRPLDAVTPLPWEVMSVLAPAP